MSQSAFDRVAQYVEAYNQHIANKDVAKATEFARLAVRDATDALKDDTYLRDYQKNYFKGVISQLKIFLDNPQQCIVASATEASNDSYSKIQQTDWFDSPIPNLGINDIAGLQNLKDEFVVNIFAPLSPAFSDIYRKYRGEDNTQSVLLFGPPGVGKTHAVKCLAGELKCKIAVVKISDVMANLVGDGAKIINEIFNQAKKQDRCVIFFDELDSIGSSRESDDSRHTKEQLTQLLTNMDGFSSEAKPGQLRIIIASSNRPWALDSAITRAGRFGTKIYVPLPDKAARKALLKMALRSNSDNPIPLAPDVHLDWLIEKTEGYSGADIKGICRQASVRPMKREILARREGKTFCDSITKKDFEEVFAKYINSITYESLAQFDAYRMNMAFDEKYYLVKCDQLICNYYKKYLYEKNGDTAGSDSIRIEPFEEDLFWTRYDHGFVDANFGKKYDLTFLKELRNNMKR